MSHLVELDIPLKSRGPDDILPPGDFCRRELDRPIEDINTLYTAFLGDEFSPITTAVAVMREMGSLAVVEPACGTARSLKTLGDAVCRLTACDQDNIKLTGVNLFDYSKESEDPEVIEACQTGRIDYQVDNALRLRRIPGDSADIVQSFFGMANTNKPIRWLDAMIRATKPGGYMFFNTSNEQGKPTSPLNFYIRSLEEAGFSFAGIYSSHIDKSRGFRVGTALCRLQKPFTDGRAIPNKRPRPTNPQASRMILYVGAGLRPDGSM